MAYTSFEKMRLLNKERFGKDVGPFQPELKSDESGFYGLKAAALRFIHDRCEELLFDSAVTAREAEEGIWYGEGISPNQVPYDMQMDTNRLCLEKELGAFIDSGTAEDAYTVYYSFMEMFFGRYGRSKKMIELLSEFESNGSSVLLKHRDHYSHSVYVFSLGLAVYETNEKFRSAFREFYDPDMTDNEAACRFLKFWGLASLFHDIGYPFELPFEQVMSYFEVAGNFERGTDTIFLTYDGCSAITSLSPQSREHFKNLFGRDFANTNELFSFCLTKQLGTIYGFDEAGMLEVLIEKPSDPAKFGYYMDHAWFSATRLFSELVSSLGAESIEKDHMDALLAIILHNSLYKFNIAFYKDPSAGKPQFRMEWNPLAYLLMFCDELQCWDRTAYGRNSRTELHPMAARFDFSNESVSALYIFDIEEKEKILAFEDLYNKWLNDGKQGKAPRLKDYSDMAVSDKFVSDIGKIVDLSQLPLSVTTDMEAVDRSSKHTYLSTSNFLHLYDFAVSLHNRYSYNGEENNVTTDQMEQDFENISLEYQVSTINQAKSFSRYLNAIHSFFTDRPVDYDMINAFTQEQTEIFAPMEHERWVKEHRDMGWTYGTDYETIPVDSILPSGMSERQFRRILREQTRMHKLMMNGELTRKNILEHYHSLSEEDQGKDWKPFNSMLKLIKKYDGLRIYTLPE